MDDEQFRKELDDIANAPAKKTPFSLVYEEIEALKKRIDDLEGFNKFALPDKLQQMIYPLYFAVFVFAIVLYFK